MKKYLNLLIFLVMFLIVIFVIIFFHKHLYLNKKSENCYCNFENVFETIQSFSSHQFILSNDNISSYVPFEFYNNKDFIMAYDINNSNEYFVIFNSLSDSENEKLESIYNNNTIFKIIKNYTIISNSKKYSDDIVNIVLNSINCVDH